METARFETSSDGLYATATAAAFASATASVVLCVLLALFYVLSSTLWSGSAS